MQQRQAFNRPVFDFGNFTVGVQMMLGLACHQIAVQIYMWLLKSTSQAMLPCCCGQRCQPSIMLASTSYAEPLSAQQKTSPPNLRRTVKIAPVPTTAQQQQQRLQQRLQAMEAEFQATRRCAHGFKQEKIAQCNSQEDSQLQQILVTTR